MIRSRKTQYRYAPGSFFLVIAGFILLSGCDNVSSLDNKRITSTSLLGAEISITCETESDYLSTDSREYNRIKVSLFDSKNIDIKNPSIRVFMNGTEMPLLIESRLLYNELPYYYLSEPVQAKKTYCFTLVLSDGSVHKLAAVISPDKLSFAQFNFPEAHSKQNDLNLRWQKIDPPTQLYVYRSSYPDQNKDSANATIETRQSQDALKKEIGKRTLLGFSWFRSASLTVPKSFFRMRDRIVTHLTFDVVSVQEGRIWDGFLKNSRISASFSLKKTIQLFD